MTAPFHLEPLSEAHDRTGFACGEDALDRYFQSQVTQDSRRHIGNCFVAVEASTDSVVGYYTIAATSIPTPDLPADITKRLPRYPSIPAVRIGRLAIDQRYHRRGLGGALLVDALQRVVTAPAAYAPIVDAKNDQAVAFYQHHGFVAFAGQPRTLFLPVATAAKLLTGR